MYNLKVFTVDIQLSPLSNSGIFSLPRKETHYPLPASHLPSGSPALSSLGNRAPTFCCHGVACSGHLIRVESWNGVWPSVPGSLLSITISGFICIMPRIRTLLLFRRRIEYYSIVHMYHVLFIRSSFSGHSGFYFSAV